MPWVGFEPTIPAFEPATTVHILDRSATVIGCNAVYANEYTKAATFPIFII
jgi:hypothetical protein